MPQTTRRRLLTAAASAALASVVRPGAAAPKEGASAGKSTLCLFSKHLPHLDYPEMARALKSWGFGGVDLTVRPGGHVLPENAARDLPKAHEALAAEGVELPMITTGLTSINDPAARPTLYTAAKLGVPFFKIGYYRLRDLSKMEEVTRRVKQDLDGLAGLAAHAKIQGGFHNHSGGYIGSAVWDSYRLLEDVDPRAVGFYFDPCHATIEGGDAGWEMAFHLVKSRLSMVACKDFFWDKVGGEWKRTMCPLGQGMVDYPKFFKLLAESGFSGPISLHVEYEIEGPTEAAVHEKTAEAIEQDFAYLRSEYEKAFG